MTRKKNNSSNNYKLLHLQMIIVIIQVKIKIPVKCRI